MSKIKPATPDDSVMGELDESTQLQMKDFFDAKVDGGKKTVWGMTIETIGMAEGSSGQKDIYAPNVKTGMTIMKAMFQKAKKQDEGKEKWKFDLVPMKDFNATLDDVLRAFLVWSRKEEETRYNITKAFTRLTSYASWMEDHREDLEAPFEINTLKKAHDAWDMKLTYDTSGRVVWWLDLALWNVNAIKKEIKPRDHLRFVFYICHLVMFDKKAQENGIIFIESMGKMGMIESFTLVPMDLGTQMDRLTIGVLPLRAKAIYTYNHLRWMSIMMTLFKPFLSAKMRKRIIIIPRNENPAGVIEKEVGGKTAIPMVFAGLKGGKVKEDILSKFMKSKEEDTKAFSC